MSINKINLAFRFFLEIAALVSYFLWGMAQLDCILRYFLAIAIVVLVSFIWGVFNVPDDPSRSGRALVPVPGIFRLILELIIFAVSVIMLYDIQHHLYASIFGISVILHYALSIDRIKWLLNK